LLSDEHNVKGNYIFYNLNSNIQRMNLGYIFGILNKEQIIVKNKKSFNLNNRGLYELKSEN